MFYSNYMALSRVVSEIYNVEKYRDHEILVKSQSRSLKVVSFDRDSFLLVFYSNFVPKTSPTIGIQYGRYSYETEIFFWDIRPAIYSDLENRFRGSSRSLKMSPFDREPMTSYWRPTANMALSRVVSEIFNVEKYRDPEIPVRGQSRSLKVIPFDRPDTVSY